MVELSDSELKTVGKRLKRKDVKSKVTGRTRFVGDIAFGDMYHLKVVRSTYAHAEITSIDIDKGMLEELNARVFTHKDVVGKNRVHVILDDWVLLAEEKVTYVGQPVALVVAETIEKAVEAVEAVEVNYKPLKAVFNPVKAKEEAEVKIYGENNVFSVCNQRNGDIKTGFEHADVIIENEYRTPAQDHAYLENHGAIAVPEMEEGLRVYFSGQCPFYVQGAVAEIINKPLSQVRVIQAPTGGAFGGKEDQPSQICGLVSVAADLIKKPVSFMLSREEDIESCSKRHPAVINVKTGATKDGKLVAWEEEIILNTGAAATIGPPVLYRGTLHAVGPYYCPHVDVNGYLVATNLVPFGAFRGFGSPQTLFAAEEQMDRLAHKLGMDPAKIREINMLKAGDETPFGQYLDHSVGSLEALNKALAASNWKEKWKKPLSVDELRKAVKDDEVLSGIGMSSIFYGVGLGAEGKHMSKSGAYVQLHEDGSVAFAVGNTEMGQGMITVLSQIVAESLGVPYENVDMVPVDTSRVPDSGPTVASRATTFSGRALRNACKQINETLIELASEELGASESELTKKGYKYTDKSGNLIQVEELIKKAYEKRLRVAEAGWDIAPDTNFDKEKGRGKAYVVYAWCTNIVELNVDVATGVIHVDKIYAAHDVGKAINPQTLEGQIEGGSLQGAGLGRYEEIVWNDSGEIESNTLGTYIIPSIFDAPEIFPIIVEHAYKEGPFGAKGMAEQPLMGIAPALTNAFYNATGVRLNEIPATPERVWKAIQNEIKKEA